MPYANTLQDYSSALLLESKPTKQMSSLHCPSGREFGPFQQGDHLSSLISLILVGKRMVQVQRHIRRRDAIFPLLLPLSFGKP